MKATAYGSLAKFLREWLSRGRVPGALAIGAQAAQKRDASR